MQSLWLHRKETSISCRSYSKHILLRHINNQGRKDYYWCKKKIAWNQEKEVVGNTKYNPNKIAIPPTWNENTNEGTKALNFDKKTATGLPILNERFVNWIYLSPFSNFKKLWGKVKIQKVGNYKLKIESEFDLCKKGILITEKTWKSCRNFYLSYGLMSIGLPCIISAIILKKLPPRE